MYRVFLLEALEDLSNEDIANWEYLCSAHILAFYSLVDEH